MNRPSFLKICLASGALLAAPFSTLVRNSNKKRVDKRFILFQPDGKLEHFFKAISEGVEKNMSDTEKLQFREDHGIKVVGLAIDYLKQ